MPSRLEYATFVQAWWNQLASTEQARVRQWLESHPPPTSWDLKDTVVTLIAYAFAFMPTILYSNTFHRLPER